VNASESSSPERYVGTEQAVGETPAPTPEPVPDAVAAFWLAHFSFRELVRRKRLLALGAIVLLPVLMIVILRTAYSGPDLTPHLILATLGYHVYVPFLIPIIALAVGVSAISEQIAEGTLVFPWSRPVRRGTIFIGRVLSAQLVASTLLVLSMVGCFMAMTIGRLGTLTLDLVGLYLGTCVVMVLGAFAYTALFALVGTILRKPMLTCILFAFVWEGMVADIPQRIQEFSLRFHLRNLIERPAPPPGDRIGEVVEALLESIAQKSPVADWRSILILLTVTILATLIGIRALGSREIPN
jgi:hypothetical protein